MSQLPHPTPLLPLRSESKRPFSPTETFGDFALFFGRCRFSEILFSYDVVHSFSLRRNVNKMCYDPLFYLFPVPSVHVSLFFSSGLRGIGSLWTPPLAEQPLPLTVMRSPKNYRPRLLSPPGLDPCVSLPPSTRDRHFEVARRTSLLPRGDPSRFFFIKENPRRHFFSYLGGSPLKQVRLNALVSRPASMRRSFYFPPLETR